MAKSIIIHKSEAKALDVKRATTPNTLVEGFAGSGVAIWGRVTGDITKQEDLMALFSGIPEDEKEVITVLTASENEPEEAVEGDYYIDLSYELLFQYDGEDWNEAEVSQSVLYIAADTSHIYRYNGSEFIDVTGQKVDDIIYVHSLSGLDSYTDAGIYTVCQQVSGMTPTYYTMVVKVTTRRPRGGGTIRVYTQLLHNNNGYKTRNKQGSGDWSNWDEFVYASQDELKKIKGLALAGL